MPRVCSCAIGRSLGEVENGRYSGKQVQSFNIRISGTCVARGAPANQENRTPTHLLEAIGGGCKAPNSGAHAPARWIIHVADEGMYLGVACLRGHAIVQPFLIELKIKKIFFSYFGAIRCVMPTSRTWNVDEISPTVKRPLY